MTKALHKGKHLKLSRQTIRELSSRGMAGVQGGTLSGVAGLQIPYTSACAKQTANCGGTQ